MIVSKISDMKELILFPLKEVRVVPKTGQLDLV